MLGVRPGFGLCLMEHIRKNHIVKPWHICCVSRFWIRVKLEMGYFDRFQVFNSSEPLDCYASHHSPVTTRHQEEEGLGHHCELL